MNPIFQSSIGNGMNAVRGMAGGDPRALLSQMAMTNPQAQQVLNMLNGGANPEQLYRQLCQQRGVNPDEFLQTIKGYMR